jgi:hypothetical protein
MKHDVDYYETEIERKSEIHKNFKRLVKKKVLKKERDKEHP